jgi:very-short-patch-repair endonuclease
MGVSWLFLQRLRKSPQFSYSFFATKVRVQPETIQPDPGRSRSTPVESAQQLARTTTRQPLTNGTRASNQITRQPNRLSNTGRDPLTTADVSFPLEPRPLIVFVDGRVHVGTVQVAEDEVLLSLLTKRGYMILEFSYNKYSDSKRRVVRRNPGEPHEIGLLDFELS